MPHRDLPAVCPDSPANSLGKPEEATVAASEPARLDAPEEFSAAAPGEPETRIAAAGSEAIPDDDPTFDAENPLELGFNDKGFPGFSEQELAGMPV